MQLDDSGRNFDRVMLSAEEIGERSGPALGLSG